MEVIPEAGTGCVLLCVLCAILFEGGFSGALGLSSLYCVCFVAPFDFCLKGRNEMLKSLLNLIHASSVTAY